MLEEREGALPPFQEHGVGELTLSSWPPLGFAPTERELLRARDDPWRSGVPRHLVNRQSVAQVLLTTVVELDRGEAVLAAQWARAQRFFVPNVHGEHDPMLLVETFWQAAVALAHVELGVDSTAELVLREFEFRIDNPGLLAVGSQPANLVIRTRLRGVRWRGPQLRRGQLDARMWRGGRCIGVGTGAFSCVDADVAKRLHLRARSGPMHLPDCTPLDVAQSVGRLAAEDVLLCACHAVRRGRRSRFSLRIDTDHPALFDGEHDAVPAIALAEAARQAAQLSLGEEADRRFRIRRLTLRYADAVPIELAVPLSCEPVPEGRRVLIGAGDEPAVEATFELDSREDVAADD
ncbi:MAG: AfsA-related hotdog domain-containing protein [Actinomycetota bacterium]|nr:AfsA-related hotdog domain-containing protein [Actinomycetota bacterium]